MSSPQELHLALGLTDEELASIHERLGRDPNRTELAMYAAMWSEHCSYKSSKVYLKRLPTTGDRVLVGPGEDAGAVDIGDGLAVVFKIESHSHPSAVEPFQGAATGVGGIVRDILSMGARPIALLDPLRFGPLTEERNRYLFGGVVAGIGQYGNSIGIPTIGGEVSFADPHSANPTVNVMCVGVAPADRLMRAGTLHAGSLLVLIGASTGRDGIGGVSVLASRTLEDDAQESRPSVQIGDPFAEKLLIEACLELVERDLLEGLQDLGGAGLTCAVSETVAHGKAGAELDLDAVPLREPGLEPFEILTSESQERMLAVVASARLADISEVCERWGLDATVVGTVTGSDRLHVTRNGEKVADVPPASLADEGPEYRRPMEAPSTIEDVLEEDPTFANVETPLDDSLFALLGSPGIASKRWVIEQYDFLVQGGTVGRPGADAAVIRIGGTLKALALSTDGNGRFGHLDPYLGAAHAVAEAARNVASVGAKPIAMTNCMNFGNPERPEVMWAFSEAVRGLTDACTALETPVTGGNVSFYNESGDSAIWPTPIVGMLGLMEDYRLMLRPAFSEGGLVILQLGDTFPELGGSAFAEAVLGTVAGRPPALDLEKEKALQELLVDAAAQDLLASAHDCSEGGMAVALAECAMAGDTGFAVSLRADVPAHVTLFSESASRAVVSVRPQRAEELEALAATRGVPCERLGETGGPSMMFAPHVEISVGEARAVYEESIPKLMTR